MHDYWCSYSLQLFIWKCLNEKTNTKKPQKNLFQEQINNKEYANETKKQWADLPTNTCFINCKSFHRSLHPIKACTLPHKINTEPMIYINRNSLNPTKQLAQLSTELTKEQKQ